MWQGKWRERFYLRVVYLPNESRKDCPATHYSRGGGTPLFELYGDVPLDRVWFFGLAVLNRVYNSTCNCPKQGMVLQAERLKPRLRAVSFFS